MNKNVYVKRSQDELKYCFSRSWVAPADRHTYKQMREDHVKGYNLYVWGNGESLEESVYIYCILGFVSVKCSLNLLCCFGRECCPGPFWSTRLIKNRNVLSIS